MAKPVGFEKLRGNYPLYVMGLTVLAVFISCSLAMADTPAVNLEESLPVDAVVQTTSEIPVWSTPLPDSKVVWERIISPQGVTGFIALRLTVSSWSRGSNWKIEITDAGDPARIVAVYEPNQFIQLGKQFSIWTPDVKGSSVGIVVKSSVSPPGVSFVVDRYATEKIEVPVKSQVNPKVSRLVDITDVKSVPKYYKRAGAIAKLVAYHETKRRPCTSFLIMDNVAVTSEHCVPSEVKDNDECHQIQLVLGYESDDTETEVVYCRKLIKKSYPLDYAVLELVGSPGKKYGSLGTEKKVFPKRGDKLFIIQHPFGEYKQIAIEACIAGRIGVAGRAAGKKTSAQYNVPQDFEHSCDTWGGSSGSPIFDEHGSLVGIHHYGFEENASYRWNKGVLGSLVWSEIEASISSMPKQVSHGNNN